ncbi:MAG: PAS domain S-box protein [Magnetococcales bacterium]|nr:PAS domain S-box protein [Magnetococcales bacterium]
MRPATPTRHAPAKEAPPTSHLHATIQVLAGVLMAFGLLTMTGWHTRTPWMVQWHPHLVPMMYNTALDFVIMGGGLLLALHGHARSAMILGITGGGLALIILFQYWLEWDFDVDQLFVEHFINVKASHPGRMAANTATCFFFTGLGLTAHALLALPRRSLWVMLCGTLVTGLGLTAAIGYAFDLESAIGWGQWTRMAIQTSLNFLVLGVGMVTLAWTDERQRLGGLPHWLPLHLFSLLTIVFLATLLALFSHPASQETHAHLFQFIANLLPILSLALPVLIALLVHAHQVTRHRATLLEQTNRNLTEQMSERHKAEQALFQSRERLRTLLETSPVGVFETDATGACQYVNDQWLKIAGITHDEAMGDGWTRTLHPEDRKRVCQEWANTVREKRPLELEFRLQRPDGAISHVLGMARALRDHTGEVTGFVGSIIDITERKLAVAELAHYQTHLEKLVEERTREKEEATRNLNRRNALFHSFVSATPDGFWIMDANGRILEVNDHYCALSGYTRPELLAMRPHDLEASENPQEVATHIAHLKQQGLDRFLTRHRAKSGATVPLEVSAAFIQEHQQFVAFLRDMRPWEKMIADVRKERDRAQGFLDIVNVIIIALDPRGRITMINQKGCAILGLKEADLLHQPWFDRFVPPEMRPMVWEAFDKLISGQLAVVESLENEILTSSGERRLVAWRNALIRDEAGRVIGTLGSGQDITEHRELQERLRQSEKMEAMGVLSGGVAHNFNNILAMILGNAELAQLNAADHAEALESILAAVHKGKELVNQLLAFSRRIPLRAQPFSMSHAVMEAVKLMKSVLPATVQLTTSVEEGDAMVVGDAAQFQHVIVNLVTNAGQALGEKGGKIHITLTRMKLTDAHAKGFNLPPGNHVRLVVEDNGPGIPPEIRKRIFEPFFTTKAPGKGTGLGLALAHGVIHNAGGTIVCESPPDQGAKFTLFIPCSREMAAGATEGRGDIIKGQGRVVYVDDEPTLAAIGKRMLDALGYEGECFVDPQEALDAYRRHPGNVLAVITDQVMPRMTGVELAQRLHAITPALPVLLLTGFSEEISEETAIAQGIARFFLKPVELKELASALAEVAQKNGNPLIPDHPR